MNPQNIWNSTLLPDGVLARDITIKSNKGGSPLKIVHITDMHLNLCDEEDFAENDPTVMSTYEHRIWLKNGESLDNAVRCLEHARDADMTVITGDILDYLSHGCIELAKNHVFKPYKNVLACLGNHETARRVQGKIADTMPYDEKIKKLKAIWPNDLFYSSVILDERVMLIQMDNCSNGCRFSDEQAKKLAKDIKFSREKGYIALLFFHVNIATDNKEDIGSKAITVGDRNYTLIDYNGYGISEKNGESSKAVCEIIKNNADVINGCFCGHMHSDFYTEIVAKDKDGNDARIPQYLLIGAAYDKGHILNINVE